MIAHSGAARTWSSRIAAAVPPVLVILLTIRYAVDVPYWDTWDWLDRHYPTAQPAAPWLQRYWQPFNGHRVFVSLVVDRALFWASGIDVWPRIALKLALSLLTLLLILRLARATVRHVPSTLSTGILAALAFPLAYWPMWMDPRQFSLHLVVVALVTACSVAVGASTPRFRITVTALSCAVASLSYGPGMLTWPIVFALLMLVRPRPSGRLLFAWSIVGLVFIGQQLAASTSGTTALASTAPATWWATVHAAAAVAGLPVAPALEWLGYRPTRVMGGLGVMLFLVSSGVAWRSGRDLRRRALPWLALGTWGLAYAFTAALTRGGLPLASLHDPRFAYGSALLWIAIVVLIQVTYVGRDASEPQSAHSPWPSRLGRVSTWAICAGLAATSVWPFVAPGGIARLHDQLVRGRTCLVNDCLADDACLERLHPSAARVRAITIHLKDRGATFLRAPQPHETQCGQGDAVDHRERSEGSSSPARTGQ